MDRLLAWGVDQTQGTVEGARSNVAELGLLWRQAFSDANGQLLAQWQQNQRNKTSRDTPTEHPAVEPELWAPPYLNSEPSSDPTDDLHLLDPL